MYWKEHSQCSKNVILNDTGQGCDQVLLTCAIFIQSKQVLIRGTKALAKWTPMQVDASFGLAFHLATHLRRLAMTCVDLR